MLLVVAGVALTVYVIGVGLTWFLLAVVAGGGGALRDALTAVLWPVALGYGLVRIKLDE